MSVVPRLSSKDFELLMPFHVMWDASGRFKSMSSALKRFWHQPEDVELKDVLLVRPFPTRLEVKWFSELTHMVLLVTHQCCLCREHNLRAELIELEDGGWLLVGRPDVNQVSDLGGLGLALSDLPLHMGLGDLLIANEAAQISLTESNQAAEELRRKNREIVGINEAFARFVPQPYLETLELSSPEEAELGVHVGVEKTVMFADLRDFTTLSEQLSSEEIFTFINAYLAQVAPPIDEQGGFVLHYLGDGIMALFPDEPEGAITAAVLMQRRLRAWRPKVSLPPGFEVRLGIGLHAGHLELGIVGQGERWDSSIISDAVNTASRIEGLTKTFGADLLITEATRDRLPDSEAFSMRRIGRIGVKGKADQVVVFEVMDSLPEVERERRERINEPFERGVSAFEEHNLVEARAMFLECLALNPIDPVSLYYARLLNCDVPSPQPQKPTRRTTKVIY